MHEFTESHESFNTVSPTRLEAHRMEAVRLLSSADSYVLITITNDEKALRTQILHPTKSLPIFVEGFAHMLRRFGW